MNILEISADQERDALIVASESGLFEAEELEYMKEIISKVVIESSRESENFFLAISEEGVVMGGLYYKQEEFAPGVMNILFMSTRPEYRRSGVGTALIKHTLDYLNKQNARVVLVETSNQDQLLLARTLYENLGFHKVGEVPDYYDHKDNKIIYSLTLG